MRYACRSECKRDVKGKVARFQAVLKIGFLDVAGRDGRLDGGPVEGQNEEIVSSSAFCDVEQSSTHHSFLSLAAGVGGASPKKGSAKGSSSFSDEPRRTESPSVSSPRAP